MNKEIDAIEEGYIGSTDFAEVTTHNLSETDVSIKPEIGAIQNKRVFYSRMPTIGVLMVCAALGSYFTYQLMSNQEGNAFESDVGTVLVPQCKCWIFCLSEKPGFLQLCLVFRNCFRDHCCHETEREKRR
jgi:hypothetical protein